MNIFFTVNNVSIDLANNPYFSVRAYVMNDSKSWHVTVPNDDEIKFGKCNATEIAKYTGAHNVNYFKNSLCF